MIRHGQNKNLNEDVKNLKQRKFWQNFCGKVPSVEEVPFAFLDFSHYLADVI